MTTKNDRFQLISGNGRWLVAPTVQLSTVELPTFPGMDLGYKYESCLFTLNGGSDVIERYDTLAEAVAGHVRLSAKFNLS